MMAVGRRWKLTNPRGSSTSVRCAAQPDPTLSHRISSSTPSIEAVQNGAMRLVAIAFMTVDGVVEGPGGDEHRDGKNKWALRVQNKEDEEYNRAQVFDADALLLGRKTYQAWAAFWPTAPRDDLADRINEMPKYVASRTLKTADWNNTSVISDVPTDVRRLKDQTGGQLVVYGSPDLLDTLLEHDLVDEFRILIYPTVLGSGKHLFADGIETHHLDLTETRVFGSGVVLLTYVPQGVAPTSRFETEYSWTGEQVRSLQAAQDADRVLATVLFTDLIDSTKHAATLGDRAWRSLLERHDETARGCVKRWMGEYVNGTGDGFVATFDTPTRALRCAFDLRDAIARLGLEMRASIHTGEVERRHNDVAGIAVHIASRVLGEAGPGQVFVTKTVIDLATGVDLGFTPLDAVQLRGVPGRWELFEASLG
jgi:class 3 adenylate cyclase/dihydrofolate reductase